MTRVAITGAAGRMGRALIQAVSETEGVSLGVALDRPGSSFVGIDAGELANVEKLGVKVTDELTAVTDGFDVLIDFTRPEVTLANLEVCRKAGKRIVIGTTGFDDTDKAQISIEPSWIPSGAMVG